MEEDETKSRSFGRMAGKCEEFVGLKAQDVIML